MDAARSPLRPLKKPAKSRQKQRNSAPQLPVRQEQGSSSPSKQPLARPKAKVAKASGGECPILTAHADATAAAAILPHSLREQHFYPLPKNISLLRSCEKGGAGRSFEAETHLQIEPPKAVVSSEFERSEFHFAPALSHVQSLVRRQQRELDWGEREVMRNGQQPEQPQVADTESIVGDGFEREESCHDDEPPFSLCYSGAFRLLSRAGAQAAYSEVDGCGQDGAASRLAAAAQSEKRDEEEQEEETGIPEQPAATAVPTAVAVAAPAVEGSRDAPDWSPPSLSSSAVLRSLAAAPAVVDLVSALAERPLAPHPSSFLSIRARKMPISGDASGASGANRTIRISGEEAQEWYTEDAAVEYLLVVMLSGGSASTEKSSEVEAAVEQPSAEKVTAEENGSAVVGRLHVLKQCSTARGRMRNEKNTTDNDDDDDDDDDDEEEEEEECENDEDERVENSSVHTVCFPEPGWAVLMCARGGRERPTDDGSKGPGGSTPPRPSSSGEAQTGPVRYYLTAEDTTAMRSTSSAPPNSASTSTSTNISTTTTTSSSSSSSSDGECNKTSRGKVDARGDGVLWLALSFVSLDVFSSDGDYDSRGGGGRGQTNDGLATTETFADSMACCASARGTARVSYLPSPSSFFAPTADYTRVRRRRPHQRSAAAAAAATPRLPPPSPPPPQMEGYAAGDAEEAIEERAANLFRRYALALDFARSAAWRAAGQLDYVLSARPLLAAGRQYRRCSFTTGKKRRAPSAIRESDFSRGHQLDGAEEDGCRGVGATKNHRKEEEMRECGNGARAAAPPPPNHLAPPLLLDGGGGGARTKRGFGGGGGSAAQVEAPPLEACLPHPRRLAALLRQAAAGLERAAEVLDHDEDEEYRPCRGVDEGSDVVHGERSPPSSNYSVVLELSLFIYGWQLAGAVHLIGHRLAAWFTGVGAVVHLPWQRFVPIWGWAWNLYQPHDAMYVKMDPSDLATSGASARVAIGFAGPYLQLAYMLLLGRVLRTIPTLLATLGAKMMTCGPFANRAVMVEVPTIALRGHAEGSSSSEFAIYFATMATWQLLYFVWYANFFFDDCYSDFSYFVRRGSDQCPEPMRTSAPAYQLMDEIGISS